MTYRALIAQQIGSWLPAADGHQFAQYGGLALAETFPIETLDLDADVTEAGRRFVSEDLQLHLIRSELGDAVSYARTRTDEQATLLSLTNTSSLPALIDEGLSRFAATETEKNGMMSVVLQQSISLAALRLRRDDEDLICLLRIDGRESGSPVELMSDEYLFDIAGRAAAKRRARSQGEEDPG